MIGAAGACYTMSALLAPKRATSYYVMYVPCPAGGPIAPAGCSANALGHRVCGDQEHLGEASNSVIASHTILFVTNLGDVPQNLAKVHSTLDLGETAVFVELCLPEVLFSDFQGHWSRPQSILVILFPVSKNGLP